MITAVSCILLDAVDVASTLDFEYLAFFLMSNVINPSGPAGGIF
jgi:hypothetical protein